MSAYRENAKPRCVHLWATFWRPLVPGGTTVCACWRCGAPLSGWRLVLWHLTLWDPKGPHLVGRPPSPPGDEELMIDEEVRRTSGASELDEREDG